MSNHTKKGGFDLYDSLGKPQYVVAPMVDASELAWRMLSRRYGSELCYTPMLHSAMFVKQERYRREALQTCPEDRPLIVQFCANDPDIFLKAVKYTVEMIDCDAIDLNLGCPQIIAKRGHFGAYLQDEWELLQKMISTVHKEVDIPITAKLRVFEDKEKTIKYAQMLEAAGAQILTVHGRTREQKGPLTGLADWDLIKAVKDNVKVPVFANGNIQYLEDVKRCIVETGVEGVMTAEGNLTNPALFSGNNPVVWDMCLEYLDLVDEYPCPLSFARGHIFKILHHLLQIKTNFDMRAVIAKSQSFKEFRTAAETLKERYLPYVDGSQEWEAPEEVKQFKLKFPPWICQPYVRLPPHEHLEKMKRIKEEEAIKAQNCDNSSIQEEFIDANGENRGVLSKKKLKKLERNPYKRFKAERPVFLICENEKYGAKCPNSRGDKCERSLCKKCCKTKCFYDELDCIGHKCFVKTNREKSRLKNREDANKQTIV